MIIIAEKINASNKRVRNAIIERDSEYIKELAQKETPLADYIDCNVATGRGGTEGEAEDMEWAIGLIQQVSDKPISLDSTDPGVIEAGLKKCNKPPMINSVASKNESLDRILSIAKKSGASVIGLAMSDEISGDPGVRLGGGQARNAR